jgi:hypothetical protein
MYIILIPYKNKYYTIDKYLMYDRNQHNMIFYFQINLSNLKISFEHGEKIGVFAQFCLTEKDIESRSIR